MTHHPHVHMIVLGGGISLDWTRWIGVLENFLLPALTRMFRSKMLSMLKTVRAEGRLEFFGHHAELADRRALDNGYLTATEIASLKLDAGWVITSA